MILISIQSTRATSKRVHPTVSGAANLSSSTRSRLDELTRELKQRLCRALCRREMHLALKVFIRKQVNTEKESKIVISSED